MRPVSDEFLRTVRGSHVMFARAKVIETFQTGTQPTGTEITILDGDAKFDAGADVRGSVRLRTDGLGAGGLGAFTRDPTGLLTPYGNELFVERGVKYGNGVTETVSLGYFKIYSVDQDEAPRGPLDLVGLDRMAGIRDARLVAPVAFSAGTSVEVIFETLVGEVYPTATIEFDFNAAGTFIQTNQVADEERYEFLRDLARSRGKIMFWDYRGVLRVEDAPDPTEPVFTVNHGRDGVLVELSRSLDREGVYNAVVALGEQPSNDVPPVRAVARDVSLTSPTYWDGKFGKVPRFYSSPFITTTAQAQSAAEKILQRAIGLPYSVDLRAVPNPALEPLDPVAITSSDAEQVTVHVLETLTIPLTVDAPLVATTRELTDVEIGVE